MASEVSGEHAASYAANGQASNDSHYLASTNSIQGSSSIDSSAPSAKDYLATNGIASPARSRQTATSENTKASRVKGSGRNEANTNSTKENGYQEGDLWSSILNSIKSSRAIPVKNVIVLGEWVD